MFDPQTGLIPLFVRATLHLLNSFTSIDTFYENLRSIDLVDETRLRPTWDAYFMQLANLAAQRSNCMKRRVGCVLVREKRVISTGYNGTPRGLTNCNDGGCSRCNNGRRFIGRWREAQAIFASATGLLATTAFIPDFVDPVR
ncbi:Deoxycytidine monophosphate (dCMP) deaminase [Orbilia oligospora]|uniref:dCMP deaminase n=1 Tax=Orbilia oligospora TaxID=2813651 RepID=A0A7C8VMR5_ORBOL|nr:Deoxycytidine monophosphate (dCMP) deaminase [Orbilia oligospora]